MREELIIKMHLGNKYNRGLGYPNELFGKYRKIEYPKKPIETLPKEVTENPTAKNIGKIFKHLERVSKGEIEDPNIITFNIVKEE